jgi:hypothetical protein
MSGVGTGAMVVTGIDGQENGCLKTTGCPKSKENVKFTLEQDTKAQRGSTGIAVLFL